MKGKYAYWLTEEGLTLLEGWARRGLTDEQIAKNMGVNIATLYRWKDKYCDICEALKKGKEVVDIEVENALLKKALGFSYHEETRERRLNRATGEYEMVTTKSVEKRCPPDTIAAMFWLKNRRPEDWRDKVPEVQGEDHADDGFLDALNGTAAEDWADEES